MNTLRAGVGAPRMLAALGIDEMEERAYCTLLSNGLVTTEDVAHLLSLSLRKAQQLLDSIESKGLASHSPERPRRYIAASPELAIEALASQRVADIERARAAIPVLKKQIISTANTQESEQLVELITSRAALGQIVVQMLQAAQSEIVGFQRAPTLQIQGFPFEMPPDLRIRTVSDAGYLAVPGAMNSLRLDIEKGEEARVSPTLPVKMLIVDRRVGLVPLNVEDQGGPVMLVRSSSLLDSLYALFELTWERSTPVVFTQSGKLKAGKPDSRLSDAAEQVLPLLAAGLNDKAIAFEAGMSTTTLNRRIGELMKSFGTRTRFQLGWRAAMDAFPQQPAASTRNKKKPPGN